jgi:D-aminoacyl-tRNA deacylase
MRVVIQRVARAEVAIQGTIRSAIQKGLLVLAGFEDGDAEEDLQWTCAKIVQLRIFDDDQGVMNRSVRDISGEILVVSQFTLHASTKKGNRPSYIRASRPEKAIPMYDAFILLLTESLGAPVGTGEFGADMQVSLVNDGPVTIFIDSKARE